MRVLSIILGSFLVFGGFSMMMTPGITFLSIGWLLGFVFIVSGINLVIDFITHRNEKHITKWDLVSGILSIIFGSLILLSPYVMVIAKLMSIYVFNFWMIISGILRIVAAIEMKKNEDSNWLFVMILAVLSVVVGVYALFNIAVSAIAMGWMLGFFVLMSGLNLIGVGLPFAGNKEKKA